MTLFSFILTVYFLYLQQSLSTLVPSTIPTSMTTLYPSVTPMSMPTFDPSTVPASMASLEPSVLPSFMPTLASSAFLSSIPRLTQSVSPTSMPKPVPGPVDPADIWLHLKFFFLFDRDIVFDCTSIKFEQLQGLTSCSGDLYFEYSIVNRSNRKVRSSARSENNNFVNLSSNEVINPYSLFRDRHHQDQDCQYLYDGRYYNREEGVRPSLSSARGNCSFIQ